MSRYFSFGGGVSNDCIIQFVNNNLPFGGIGHSGMGKYHGKYSLMLLLITNHLLKEVHG